MRRAAVALVALAVAACAEPDAMEQARPLPTAGLGGQTWMLDTLGPDPVATPVTAVFEAGRVSGAGPCNRYFGAYETEDDRLSIDAVAATRAICPDQPLETRYFSALTEVATVAFTAAQMTLFDRDGGELMTFVAVPN